MTVSNSRNFQSTAQEIILDALIWLQVLGEDETSVEGNDFAICKRALNRLLKSWHTKGFLLPLRTEAVLPVVEETRKYTLPGALGSNTVVETELTADSATSDTTLTVTSTSGMTAADVICVVLDDGTLHDTTIVSVDSSTALTITTGVASAATSGAKVFTYTTVIGRCLKIPSVRYKNSAGYERPVHMTSRDEYFNTPNKDAAGDPTKYYFDPQYGTGYLYVWPRPDTAGGSLQITYEREICDIDDPTDTIELPVEAEKAIYKNLAIEIGPAFGRTPETLTLLKQEAQEALADFLGYDNETASLYLLPNVSNT